MGAYGFTFAIFSVASKPLHVITNFPPKNIAITQQPSLNGKSPFQTGYFLPTYPVVKVTDAEGKGVPGVVVSALPIQVGSQIIQLGMYQFSNYNLTNELQRFWLQFSGVGNNMAFTNSDGVATFDLMFILAAEGVAECKF